MCFTFNEFWLHFVPEASLLSIIRSLNFRKETFRISSVRFSSNPSLPNLPSQNYTSLMNNSLTSSSTLQPNMISKIKIQLTHFHQCLINRFHCAFVVCVTTFQWSCEHHDIFTHSKINNQIRESPQLGIYRIAYHLWFDNFR